MDAATLATAMGCTRATADRYVAACNTAMVQAGCTSLNRAAMWCAQLGHESGGLKWMAEIWGPTSAQRRYEGRRDLGNVHPGDGSKFRGRSAIQITGRHNYTAVSKWANGKGYVPTPTYFVDRPEEMAGERYGFVGAVWYWTVARPTINPLSDQGAVTAVTKLINGGTNGLVDRVARYNRARSLGTRILPDTSAVSAARPVDAPPPKPELTRRRSEDTEMFIETPAPPDGAAKIDWPRKRFVYGFDPIGGWNGKCILRVNFGPAGGWLHLARWWIRLPDWSPNDRHRMKFWDHPIGAKGTDFAIAADWQTAPPVGASSIEFDLSAPDGVHIFMPTEK